MDRDNLLNFINGHEKVYIYGAGAVGGLLTEVLLDKGINISGIVVTQRKNGQVSILGCPILELGELAVNNVSCCGFILALGSKFHCEVIKALSAAGFKEYIAIPDDFFQELKAMVHRSDVSEVLAEWPQLNVDYLHPVSWRRVLLIRLDGIGDVVLCSPFLRALRRAHPESEITLIVQPMVYELMEACPYIDHLIVYDWHADSGWPLRARCWHAREFVREQGLVGKYDIVLNPRWDEDSYDAGAIAYFTGAPCRVAWSEKVLPRKAKSNLGFDGFYTMTLLDKRICHEVEHNLQFLTQLGVNVGMN